MLESFEILLPFTETVIKHDSFYFDPSMTFQVLTNPTRSRDTGHFHFCNLFRRHSFFPPGRENACEKTSYMFLRKELPVRLANTMREVNLLPDNLLSQPSVRLVQKW